MTNPLKSIRETYPSHAPDLPDWISAPPPDVKPSESRITLANTPTQASFVKDVVFPSMFEHVLVRMSEGVAFKTAVQDDHRCPDYGAFLRWVMSDPKRKERYYEAQEIGAEVVAAELVHIADATDSLEDVQRSTLRVNTRKWLLGVWNRKRFGDTKQIDHTVTVDLSKAMELARGRSGVPQTIDAQDVMPRMVE